jgi:hypothetical protein
MNEILSEKIKTFVNTGIDSYINKVSVKYSINIDELKALVNENVENIEDDVILSSEEEEEEEIKNICTHVFKRGKNMKKCCGKKIKAGESLCSVHKKTKEKTSNEFIIGKSKILFNPELKKYSCKSTGIVFEKNNSEEFEAVGIYRSGEIQKLEEEHIKTCKKFKYLVKQ